MMKRKIMVLQKLFRFLLHPGDQLSRRVIHAGFWAFALRITDGLLGLARTIILARLLSPNDFGLFGIALLGLSALETFSQTGFQAALVQKKGDIRPYLDTAWTVQMIRGFILATILCGIAPYVATFFGEPGAANLLRVLGLSAVFKGLTNIGVVYFQKDLEFHKRFIYMFSGTLANLVVATSLAFILRNSWALAYGLLVGDFAQMVVSFFIHTYRPRPRLEGAKAKDLYTFGRWILGSNILVFLLNHGDDIFLGKVLGTTVLGLYQMAYRLSNLPATEITHTISQVTFPAYSKLQDEPGKLRCAFLSTVQLIANISFLVAAVIASLSPGFTRIFLGEEWMPIVPAVQILVVCGLIRSLDAVTSSLWQAIGRPFIPTYFQLAKLLLLAVLIYPLTSYWGMLGTAAAVALESIIVHIIRWFFMAKTLRIGPITVFRVFVVPGLSAVAIIAFVKAFPECSYTITNFFLVLIMVGVIYVIAFFLFDKMLKYNSTAPFRQLFNLLKE